MKVIIYKEPAMTTILANRMRWISHRTCLAPLHLRWLPCADETDRLYPSGMGAPSQRRLQRRTDQLLRWGVIDFQLESWPRRQDGLASAGEHRSLAKRSKVAAVADVAAAAAASRNVTVPIVTSVRSEPREDQGNGTPARTHSPVLNKKKWN